MMSCRAIPPLLSLLITAGVLTATAIAAPSPPASQQDLKSRKEDLDDLRQRIEQLRKELSNGESTRNEVADQLRGHEKAISDLQRELHDLAKTREVHLQNHQELTAHAQQAERQLTQQQSHLDRLLIQQYMTGAPGPLQLLLSGQSPTQTARDMTYLGAIAQARQGVVKETSSLIDQKKRLAEETRQQAEAISAIEARQRKQEEEMLAQRQQRQKILLAISSRLDVQKREIETLRRDEKRLTGLIDRINRLLAEKAKKRIPKPKPPLAEEKRKEKTVRPPVKAAITESLNSSFSKLRGKLATPATGTILQKFGAPQEGGGKAKGLFIRSPAGSEVRAIADGQVVFADWLRGFGNLVVLDHEDGFLSVYGYNEAVLKQVGDDVRAGERMATVGNSGGRSESGLYFELRHQGEAIDPSPWLRR